MGYLTLILICQCLGEIVARLARLPVRFRSVDAGQDGYTRLLGKAGERLKGDDR